MILPPFLQPGDRIALVSPAYRTPPGDVEGAAEVLRGWGFEPLVGAHVDCLEAGKYAGTVEERVSDLRGALRDPSVRAVLCNRGGYGTLHFTDVLTPEDFSADPKWLVGYSDITTLLGMSVRAGVVAVHGAMGSSLAASRGADEGAQRLRRLLCGELPRYALPPHPANCPGRAEGVLVGGNFCTLAPLLGTWADATRLRSFILFLEEVEESMHHIDRLFNMLLLSGAMRRCRGVVLGDFTACGDEFSYGSVEEMLVRRYLSRLGIPVLCGFPAGHGPLNLPLPMGARAVLDVRADGASLDFRG